MKGGERLFDSRRRLDRAALQRNHTGLDFCGGLVPWHAEILHGSKTTLPWQALGERIGNIARSGEIVSYDAKKHFRLSFFRALGIFSR